MLSEESTFNTLQQIYDGKTHIGEYLSLIFQRLPVGVVWSHLNSDKTDVVLDGCNQFVANILGLAEPERIVGLTEFEIQLKSKNALVTLEEVIKVYDYNKPSFPNIQQFCRRDGQEFWLSTTKGPIYDVHKNIEGVFNIFTPISELKEETATLFNMLLHSQIKDTYCLLDKQHYYINVKGQIIRLTVKQATCLTYLSMGKTVKQIANMLDCASSTVESHLDRLKLKLCVYSTSALIDCFWKNPIKWF